MLWRGAFALWTLWSAEVLCSDRAAKLMAMNILKTVLVGSDLLKEFPDAKANLEAILWRGLDVTSHFSGKGAAESIAAQIHDVIRTNVIEHGSVLGKDVNLLPANNFRSIFSCDKNPVCRKALLCMPTEHVFGSIEE